MRCRRRMGALARFAAILTLLIATACARTAPQATLPPSEMRTLAQALIERAQPFSGEGGIRAGGTLFGYAETSVMVDPRRGLRVDVFTPFMTPAGSLVLTSEGAQYLNRLEGFFVRGDAQRLLGVLLDVPVDPTPLPWILAGGIPPAEHGWSLVQRRAKEPTGALVLQSEDGAGRFRRVVLEGPEFRLTRFSVFQDSAGTGEIASIECEKHREGELPLPTRLTVRASDRGATLVWRMDKFDLGRGPSDDDLILTPPPGTAVREWR